jgi:adenine-specific DNA-methyltransferase
MKMEKLKMHSVNKVDENIKKIGELFPNTLTEVIKGYHEDGTPIIEQVVDFDVLRQQLSDFVVDGPEERYQFTWPDKKKSILLANAPIAKTLRPCRQESVDFDNTKNLYIEGDNLDALKLLQETYLGRVKLIYIDPPYNTGKDFVYEDDFAQSTDEYLANSGQFDEDGNRLLQNKETNGRIHTDWLNMIYPRLQLAYDLLSDDGVIFISIDDNEVENLKKICNEVFGGMNFIGCIVLQTATDNNPRQINTEHEYVLCFAKKKSILSYWQSKSEKAEMIEQKYIELKGKFKDDIQQIQKELRKWIRANKDSLDGVSHYDNVDEKGVFHDGDIANTVYGGYEYQVIHPITGKPCKVPDKGFRYPESTMMEMIRNNDIMFGSDETTLIKPKKRIENAKDALRSIIYEDGRASTKRFEQLMSRDIFQNPKSDTVLQRIFNFVVKDGDLVLDFFSGSGTTAEAIIKLNEKNQINVTYILVQLPENLDESLKIADSRAKKTIKNAIAFLDKIGKPHTVAEIGKERIRRAGKKF